MKKRMFLTTVLMTLVLLLAVTTATFAWYSATSGKVSGSVEAVNVTASDKTITLGDLTIVVTASPASNVGPSCYQDQEIKGEKQDAGDVFYVVDGVEIETSAVDMKYVTSGAITFTYKLYRTVESQLQEATGNLTDEEKAMLDAVVLKFTISEETNSLRFGTTADKAVSENVASVQVTIEFDANGVASFSDAYYAVNSKVTLENRTFALSFTEVK